MLSVVRIEDLSNADIRPFEREVTAVVFSQSNPVYPRSVPHQNVMTLDFIKSLPLISVKTQEHLKDWFAYLDWKERIILANLAGLRFLKHGFGINGQYRLVVVAKNKESFESARSTFRNGEIRAFGLPYSKDHWEFQYNDAYKGRGAELGDFTGYEELPPPPDINTKGMPWEQPFYATVNFRLSDDAQNEYDAMTDGGTNVKETQSHFLSLLPPMGFLASSIWGDLSLVRRQRRELEILEKQSGYAPLLSSYIFDIKAANVPNKLINIAGDQWFRTDLNDDQKLAVRKMISTPDLAMVQGPPGTGKTTMIAEAIWQFVRQGKKVLVVSQANLAVDNALEESAAELQLLESHQTESRLIKQGTQSPYCQICGKTPAAPIDLRRQVGMVVLMRTYTSEMTLCSSCADVAYRQFQKSTAIKGWTGIRSALMNPIVIGTNAVNKGKHRKNLEKKG